jgi:D-threonate/D-erythronate kinase
MTNDNLRYAVIADDLSGGMNIGVEFACAGFRTSFALAEKTLDPEAQVMIWDTETRNSDPGHAREVIGQLSGNLTCYAPPVVIKKIDSLLRGHIGIEIETLQTVLGLRPCVLVAAAPKLNRVTVKGHHYVNNQLLEVVRQQVDPTSTVQGSNIVDILTQHTILQIELLDIDVIRQGAPAIAAFIQQTVADLLVLDCTSQTELNLAIDTAYQAGVRFFAGTYGLGEAICKSGRGPQRPVLFVVGSLSLAAQRQALHLQETADCACIQMEYTPALFDLPAEEFVARYQARLGTAITNHANVVLQLSSVPAQVHEIRQWAADRGLGHEAISQRLDGILSALVQPMLPRFAGFVATGGATAFSLFQLFNAEGLRIDGHEVLPGTPGSRIFGGAYDGVPFIAKPGSQGDDDALTRLGEYVQATIPKSD